MKKLTVLFSSIALFVALTGCGDQNQSSSAGVMSDPDRDSTNSTTEWKLGIQLWTFHTFSFATALDKADSAGIKYIEAFPGQPLEDNSKDSFTINMSPEARKKVKDMLSQKGMELVAFGVFVPRTPEEWERTFQFAQDMGLKYIVSEPLKNQWDTINTLAGKYGILVAIHDHPRPNPYSDPDSVMRAIKGRINLGACADIGHWARNGLDAAKCLKTLEGRIIGVHLKDIDSFNNVHAKSVVLGKGAVNITGALQELRRQGFKGMFSIEHEANWENNVPDVISDRKYFEEQVSKLR